MFKKLKRTSAASRLNEELLYERVVNELESGQTRPGIWGKALADSEGDEQKARALYIKYRVQAIKDEADVAEAIAEQRKEVERQGREAQEKLRQREEGQRLLKEAALPKNIPCRVCGKTVPFYQQWKHPTDGAIMHFDCCPRYTPTKTR
jgi:hypothetical protein